MEKKRRLNIFLLWSVQRNDLLQSDSDFYCTDETICFKKILKRPQKASLLLKLNAFTCNMKFVEYVLASRYLNAPVATSSRSLVSGSCQSGFSTHKLSANSPV